MERLDDNVGLESLRRANVCFGQFFARFSGAPVLGTEEEIEALLEIELTLQSVRPLLDGRLPETQDAGLRDEVVRYRANLIRLREELGAMQQSATGCRARLFAHQTQLQAAKAWCDGSRVTANP